MTSNPSPTRVLIADDHQIIRDGLRLILETVDDIELAGEAVNGQEAVELAAELAPDVILMDLRMPVLDGLGAIGQIIARQPNIAIVILTTFDEDDLMLRGLRAGARAFLLKDTDRQTLLRTIRAAARGESLLSIEIMARLLSLSQTTPVSQQSQLQAAPHAKIPVSDRELEVLVLVARGERNKEIARHLGISERTVKAHLTSIFNKLGVDSRAAAVAEAGMQGLLTGFQ